MDDKPVELPPVDGEVVERIAKTELKPMYDTAHEHNFIRDPEDDEDGYYAEMCDRPNCNVGRLVAK